MPFLTLEDPRAKIKGSRDPLGVVPVWSSFGRKVVGNLTTQSNSVRGFTILLLGRYFGEMLVKEGKAHEEDVLDIFLRMEQIGAYVRYVAHEVTGDIRGIERVKESVTESKTSVPIQANAQGQILSDQKVYGLWGLFSVPARVSGLLPEGPLGLAPEARRFVETQYFKILEPALNELSRLLLKGGNLSLNRSHPIMKCLGKVLNERCTPDETVFYGDYLRDGSHMQIEVSGHQKNLRVLLEANGNLEHLLNREEIRKLAQESHQTDPILSRSLEEIDHLEAFIVPAEIVFDHLLARNGQTPKQVGDKLRDHWGNGVPNLNRAEFHRILPRIEQVVGPEIGALMDRCHDALHSGDYAEAMVTLLAWNQNVMELRNSAPWVKLDQQGKFDVRYRGNENLLPTAEELPTFWKNSYFIDSLRSLTRQLREVA